jgi:hypothetical protein
MRKIDIHSALMEEQPEAFRGASSFRGYAYLFQGRLQTIAVNQIWRRGGNTRMLAL